MSTAIQDQSCVCVSPADVSQSPFYSVNYTFGMLLGVDDFQTEFAYHAGKMRLHNQWLHREGVVWGFKVEVDQAKGILSVGPGLAIDALGRELHLDAAQCLDIAAWFAAHRNDPELTLTQNADGTITFDAHVVIRFAACLTRQVPAFADPCEGAGTATAYSRLFETVEILLRPGLPPPDPLSTSAVYHRLRLFFGLDAPGVDKNTKQVLASDQAVLDAPKDLAHFQTFAALDGIDLAPPNQAEYPLALAQVTSIKLKVANGLAFVGSDAPDVSVRPSLVATAVLQELICGAVGGGQDSQIIPGSVVIDLNGQKINFAVSKPLLPGSVTSARFSLTFLDASAPAAGWQTINLGAVNLDATNVAVTITLPAAPPPLPPGSTLRFVADCSGATPLMGANNIPLNNGRDFVFQQRI